MSKRIKQIAAAFVACLMLSGPNVYAQMKVHFIDVGQAEAILLEFRRHAVLIDAGGEDTGSTRDVDHLLGYLDAFFARRADLRDTIHSVVVSHPHIDHTRHLMSVLGNYTVLNLVDGGGVSGSGISELFAARRFAREHGIIYNKITDRRIGPDGFSTSLLRAIKDSASDASIKFLSGSRECEDENNSSLVMLVEYRQASFLFTGDAESEDERCVGQINHLLQSYGARKGGPLDIDVYKVGHHGSHNGTTQSLMRAATPKLAVISAGHHGTRTPGMFHAFQFGHPRQSTITALQQFTTGRRARKTVYAMDRAGASGGKPIDVGMEQGVYCTCWDGDVVISVNAAGSRFKVDVGSP